MASNSELPEPGAASSGHQERAVKLCGGDVELGNFVLGLERRDGSGYEASRVLLREVEGLPRRDQGSAMSWYCSEETASDCG